MCVISKIFRKLQRSKIPYLGISTVPWAFSPDTRLLVEELKFWKRLGVNTLRFNSWDNGWWCPVSWYDFSYPNEPLKRNRDHIMDLVDIWTNDLGGNIVLTIYGVDIETLELARKFYNKDTIYDVTYEDIESLRIIAIIYSGISRENKLSFYEHALQKDTVEKHAKIGSPLLHFEYRMNAYLDWVMMFFKGMPKKERIFFDIWNGAEAWQDVRHDWTVDKVVDYYVKQVGLLPSLTTDEAREYLIRFENDVEQRLKENGFMSLNRLGRHRKHLYYFKRFPYEDEIPSHTYNIYPEIYQAPDSLLLTEIGVSRLTAGNAGDLVSKYPDPQGWKIMVNQVLGLKPKLVCVHSFLDGRFREMTYDKGNCRKLYNAAGYESLCTIKGYPHYDGALHAVLISSQTRTVINQLGYKFTDSSELF